MISLKCCKALWDSVKTRAIVNSCQQFLVSPIHYDLNPLSFLGPLSLVSRMLIKAFSTFFEDSQDPLQRIAGTDFGAQLASPGPKADLASSTSVGECISQEPALAPSRDAVTGTTGE